MCRTPTIFILLSLACPTSSEVPDSTSVSSPPKTQGAKPDPLYSRRSMTERNKVGRAGIKMVGPQPNFVTRELPALEAPFQGVTSRDPPPKSSGPIHGMPVVQRLEPFAGCGCTIAHLRQAVVGPRRARSLECWLYGVQRTLGSSNPNGAARLTAPPSAELAESTRSGHLAPLHSGRSFGQLAAAIGRLDTSSDPRRTNCDGQPSDQPPEPWTNWNLVGSALITVLFL
jgi:hypothetical protein